MHICTEIGVAARSIMLWTFDDICTALAIQDEAARSCLPQTLWRALQLCEHGCVASYCTNVLWTRRALALTQSLKVKAAKAFAINTWRYGFYDSLPLGNECQSSKRQIVLNMRHKAKQKLAITYEHVYAWLFSCAFHHACLALTFHHYLLSFHKNNYALISRSRRAWNILNVYVHAVTYIHIFAYVNIMFYNNIYSQLKNNWLFAFYWNLLERIMKMNA